MHTESGMSLIEEALRRAERTATSVTQRMPTTAAFSVGHQQASRAMHPLSLRSLFMSGIIVSVGLIGWYLVWSGQWIHLRTASLADQTPALRLIPSTGIETLPAAVPPPQFPRHPSPAFRLSGIVFGPGAPVAVINDRILHPGETINNMRVTAISRSSVTLEGRNARVTLRLGD